jgi:hypothetical protein
MEIFSYAVCFLLFQAVKQFYGDAANQQEINRWLMTAQTSQQAWQFCWTLLAKDKVCMCTVVPAKSSHPIGCQNSIICERICHLSLK